MTEDWDRRTDPRMPVMLHAELRAGRDNYTGTITSVGGSGAFIATSAALDAGAKVFVRYREPDGTLIVQSALVKRRHTVADGVRGLAVEFKGLVAGGA